MCDSEFDAGKGEKSGRTLLRQTIKYQMSFALDTNIVSILNFIKLITVLWLSKKVFLFLVNMPLSIYG